MIQDILLALNAGVLFWNLLFMMCLLAERKALTKGGATQETDN